MKLLHTADWHLGQTFFDYDRSDEHRVFFNFLVQQIKELDIDVLLVSGDIFDVANPSAAAQRMFYRFLSEAVQAAPALQIVIIAGNHDSPVRLEAPRSLLEAFNITVIGAIPYTDAGTPDYEKIIVPLNSKDGEKAWCIAIPFIRASDCMLLDNNTENPYQKAVAGMYKNAVEFVKNIRKNGETIIAMGHLYTQHAELSEDDRSERMIIGGEEAVSPSVFDEELAYVALGHIHKAQRVGGKKHIRYAGSPLPMSFSETNYKHQLVFIEIGKGKSIHIQTIVIPKYIELLRIPKQPKVLDEILAELAHLPDVSENAETNTFPYLEVNVLQDKPLPGLRMLIDDALKTKAVRLARIKTTYINADKKENAALSIDDLQKMQPIDLLKNIYRKEFDTELPDEYEQAFYEIVLKIEN